MNEKEEYEKKKKNMKSKRLSQVSLNKFSENNDKSFFQTELKNFGEVNHDANTNNEKFSQEFRNKISMQLSIINRVIHSFIFYFYFFTSKIKPLKKKFFKINFNLKILGRTNNKRTIRKAKK